MRLGQLKVGDKFRFKSMHAHQVEAGYESEILGFGPWGIDCEGQYSDGSGPLFCQPHEEVELISEFSQIETKTQTTTEQDIKDETKKVARLIDEAIFYEGYEPPKVAAKANAVVGSLVEILVAKGLLSSKDVKRILDVK